MSLTPRQLEITARFAKLRAEEQGLTWSRAEPIREERKKLVAEWRAIKEGKSK